MEQQCIYIWRFLLYIPGCDDGAITAREGASLASSWGIDSCDLGTEEPNATILAQLQQVLPEDAAIDTAITTAHSGLTLAEVTEGIWPGALQCMLHPQLANLIHPNAIVVDKRNIMACKAYEARLRASCVRIAALMSELKQQAFRKRYVGPVHNGL